MITYIFAFICAFLQMGEGLRDTSFGQCLRLVGFKSYLYYPEESENFQAPSFDTVISTTEPAETTDNGDPEKAQPPTSPVVDAPKQEIIRRLSSKNISSANIVSWYSDKDPENPRNWSDAKKGWVIVVMSIYTFVVYCTASIITPTATYVMHEFNVSLDVASLGLSMYVVGYGIGPMFFSPISEIPFIGRNPPYLYSFFLFFIISIIICVVKNFPAIIALRLLQGLFGSPILASGAATIEDIYDMYSAPYGYIWWVAAMYCGPALGPLLPAKAVEEDWRWALWMTVIMAGMVMLLLPFLPETSPHKILLHRARRLRAVTGNQAYLAPSELKPLNFGATLQVALNKPLEITVKDPAIAFACIYGAIVYATYYSFFECFPMVYLGTYRMSLQGLGLIFTGSICGGCIIGVVVYHTYIRHHFIPHAKHYAKHHPSPLPQEAWLRPGLVAVFGPPIGLFIFAFTARASTHWLAPTTGIAIFAATSFVVFQSLICYIPLTYPKYVASLFAANDLARSLSAAVMVSVSRWMYEDWGVERGVCVVGGLSCFGVVGLWYLWWDGARLRARSRFTGV